MNIVVFLFIFRYFAQVTSKCDDQQGWHDYCQRNKMLCEWDGTREFMKRHCTRTCGYCDKSTIAPHPTPTKAATTTPTTPTRPTTIPPSTTPRRTNPPYKGECGRPKINQTADGSNIFGGETSKRGAWPWQLSLSHADPLTRILCGATLIHPRFAVTAAQCVYKREAAPGYFRITTGEYDRSKHEEFETRIRLERVNIHPDWNPTTKANDIALLQLQHEALLGRYVQPACFPSQDLPVGTQCFITGWGKTYSQGARSTKNKYFLSDVLRQAKVPIVGNEKCKEPLDDSTVICAGSNTASACKGDDGGPLICRINNKWELHGSISQPSKCKLNEGYTVMSRTNHFKNWIKNIISTADEMK